MHQGGVVPKKEGLIGRGTAPEPVEQLVSFRTSEVGTVNFGKSQVSIIGREREKVDVGYLKPLFSEDLEKSRHLGKPHMIPIVDPMGGRHQTRQDRDQTGSRPSAGAVGVAENNTRFRPGINLGCRSSQVSIAAEPIRPAGIDGEKQDVPRGKIQRECKRQD